jgi:hypothetical protein
VDELRSGLELATDEELQALSEILFRPRFNPLDYLSAPDLTTLQSSTRQEWLDHVEQRFRFLAADGFTVLNGRSQTISYRQVLLQVCSHLKLPYCQEWSTADIEAEVFLHLVDIAWNKLSPRSGNAYRIVSIGPLLSRPSFRSYLCRFSKIPWGYCSKAPVLWR